jgi:hypothetical protein
MIMPYLITRCWYPHHLADEVAKKYIETMEKYPPDESLAKTVVPAAVSSTRKGIQTITIDEVERQKLGDALKHDSLFMAEFRKIEGFSYEIRPWSNLEEAMKEIGMG